MFEIKGLDTLTKHLEEAAKFSEELEGSLEIKFDPSSPESIEQALVQMESFINQKAASFSTNPMIENIVNQYKEQSRTFILDRAAQARLKPEGEVDNGE